MRLGLLFRRVFIFHGGWAGGGAYASACSVRHERVSAGGRQHPAYFTDTETPGRASASTFTEMFGAFLSFFEILTSSPDCFTL